MATSAISKGTVEVPESVAQDKPGSVGHDPKAFSGNGLSSSENKNGGQNGEESPKIRTKNDSRDRKKYVVSETKNFSNPPIVEGKLTYLASRAARRDEAVHRGTASALCEGKQFGKALKVLRRMHTKNCFDLDTMLLHAECTIAVRDFLRSDNRVADFIDTASICSMQLMYVHEWGKEMAAQGRRVAAVLLYRAVPMTCGEVDLSPEECLIWCTRVVSDIRELALLMLDDGEEYERLFIRDYAVAFMSDVYKAGKSIECIPTDTCHRQKARMFASCTGDIAEICSRLEMYDLTIRYAEEGLAGVRENTSQATVLSGRLLHIQGEAYLLTGDNRNCVRCLADATVEFQKAIDFRDEQSRKSAILSVNKTLKVNR